MLNRMRETYPELENHHKMCSKLYDKINAGTEEEPSEAGPIGYMPNFIEESKWFEQAGVYFGAEETLKLQKSLMKLNFKVQAKQLRFWGKIQGSLKDYYIAEGMFDGEEGQELPANVEPRGQQGVNKMDYWVTNNLLEDWKELPVVTPEQIMLSRRIKHIFTGDLEAVVTTNPFFFEQEKYLLKAQIVRIAYSTTIVPKNFYHLTDDDPKEIELIVDEFKPPRFDELTTLNN
eukprot:TRINITY_DN9415_c0_g1_i2.p1 TRINITY_DN9415_c0_g1~~TRINITY_DN9415_c0_g1_i2.p1  ORF type:complete len:232 (-),score=38.98 TRINITY_DN9415_c0_g1_i2:685-1380(-)